MDQHTPFVLTEITPPENLLPGVLLRVAQAKRHAARVRLALSLGGVVVSGALLAPAYTYVTQAFYASGFSEYAGLFFSDTALALAHWQEISLSLTESLPSVAVLIALAVVASFAWSVRKAIPAVRPALEGTQFA